MAKGDVWFLSTDFIQQLKTHPSSSQYSLSLSDRVNIRYCLACRKTRMQRLASPYPPEGEPLPPHPCCASRFMFSHCPSLVCQTTVKCATKAAAIEANHALQVQLAQLDTHLGTFDHYLVAQGRPAGGPKHMQLHLAANTNQNSCSR